MFFNYNFLTYCVDNYYLYLFINFCYRYGKTKDAFGWPEESEELFAGQSTPAPVTTGAPISNENENSLVSPVTLTSIDK